MANYYSGDRTENMPQASWPKPGINAVGEYQMSGQPFLLTFTLGPVGNDGSGTAEIFADIAGDQKIIDDSASAIHFPAITKKITYTNGSGGDAYVYFCSTMVPSQIGGGGGGADLNGAGAAVDIVSRGNLVTTAEINAYNGASDFRPKSAVKENGTYIIVANGSTLSLNVKCRKVFIAGAGGGTANKIVAELTSIEEGYDCDYRGLPGISGGSRGSKFLTSQGA